MERMWQIGGIIERGNKEIGLDFGSCIHSDGIAGIREYFGIKESSYFGYEARKIQQIPDILNYRNDGDKTYLILDERLNYRSAYADGQIVRLAATPEQKEARLDYILNCILTSIGKTCDLSAAVGESGFAVHASNDPYVRILEDIAMAFADLDVVIDGKSSLVRGFGLLIYSRIPDQIKEEFRRQEEHSYKKGPMPSPPS